MHVLHETQDAIAKCGHVLVTCINKQIVTNVCGNFHTSWMKGTVQSNWGLCIVADLLLTIVELPPLPVNLWQHGSQLSIEK